MSVAAAAEKVPVTPLVPTGRERLMVKRMTAVGEVVGEERDGAKGGRGEGDDRRCGNTCS
jgi:hypothetical protein